MRADGQVEVFLEQIDSAIGYILDDVDPRKLGHEARQEFRERELRDWGRDAEANRPARFCEAPPHDILRRPCLRKHGDRAFVEFLAYVGDGEDSRRAIDQPDAKLILELD